MALSLLPTAALADEAGTKPVKIDKTTGETTEYETLDAAITAAKDGDTITILKAAENESGYKLNGNLTYSGKAITIKAADGTNVKFDMSAAVALHGAKITFEGVTFDYKTNGNYIGIQHADTLVYNNCTINGQVFLYAASETFNGCTFNQDSAGAYNVWTYAAKKVEFNHCAFNCVGRSVLVYNEGAVSSTDLTVTDTEFKASAPVEGKAAIEIDTSRMDGQTKITVDQATARQTIGFGTGSNSESSLWNDKKQNTDSNKNTTVVVADTTVFAPPAVAKIGDTEYPTLAAAVAAAKDDETVTLLKDTDISKTGLTIYARKSITLDLSGHSLKAANTNDGNIKVYGTLTLTDSTDTAKNGTGRGKVYTETPYSSGSQDKVLIAAIDGGTFIMESGLIDAASFTTNNTNQGQFAVSVQNEHDDATVIINGGHIKAGWYAVAGNGQDVKFNGDITVNGGILESTADYAIYHPHTGTTTINGGTVYGAAGGVSLNRGKLVVNGGKITSKGTGTTGDWGDGTGNQEAAAINVNAQYEATSVEIKGGTITAEQDAILLTNGKDGTIAVSGGTFSSAVKPEYCAPGFVPKTNSDGTHGVKINENMAAEVLDAQGNTVAAYDTLADALNAVKDGETIKLLKDANLSNAEYYINKSVTINGSGKKISCTVKTGETTRAFVVEENGSLTLDGVVLDIKGTQNADTTKNNDGTGIDVQFGGKLVLKNQAVLKLHDLNRGTIFSEPTGSPAEPGQVVINNSTFESTNIDGNASNGGDWTVTNGSTITINHCGSYGLSVNSLTTEQSTVNISGTSYSAIYGKDLQFKNGSNVLISGAGTQLSFESTSSAAKSPLQTHKDGGTLVVDSGATVTVRDCVDKNGKANNTIYLPKNTTYTNNGTVNATIITDAAPEGSCVVTLVSDGKTIGVQTVAKDSVFTLPAAPKKNNYTFNGWYDGSKFYAAGVSYKVSATVTLNASWSYISSGSSSYDPTYSVSTPSKTENGSVTVSPKNASKGDTVTVTVKPDSGYVLETLTVTGKNGNELTLKDKGNGKYTFTMPAGKVEVKATFMEDNSMLNFFYDVPNNAYFYEAVKWAVKNGITTGVGNDLFAPEQPCTRAQIVTFLWRAAGSPEPKAASSFADVAAGSYYAKAVAWAVENGITTGTTTSTFSPDATCTRAQAVTFLARALNAKAVSAAEFSDVPTDSYFADAVAWAAANGVTEGIGGGLFGPDNDCTRGQIVTFLYRAYNK